MNLSATIDTETCGIPNYNLPSDDPSQPHMAELGIILFDEDTRRIHTQLSLVVKPEGWVIPDGAAKVHKITTEIALDVGIPLKVVMRTFGEVVRLARRRLAYNTPFDYRILRTAYLRAGGSRESFDELWPRETGHCVMHACTPIVNLPPTEKMLKAGFTKPKAPKLIEAYQHFFGRGFEGAHGALADCHATTQIHWKMNETTQPAERSALPASAGEGSAICQGAAPSPATDPAAA